jgi:branched-chain amino acid transport system permease protein
MLNWIGTLPRRSADGPSTGRHPTLFGPAIVIAVAAFLPMISGSAFQLSRYDLVLTYMMVAIGLNFGLGFAGQLSIAQPVIMGAAAYCAGLLAVDRGWNAWETLVPALAVGVVAGVLLYLPGFRLKGWYLAITTFFAVLVFPDLISATQQWTQGDNGLGPIPPMPGVFGTSATAQFEFILALTAVCWLGVWLIVYSRWGIMMKGMRDSPNAAQASGVNIPFLNLSVSALAALPVGLAGWVFAHTTEIISPTSFNFNLLLLVVASVMLGGRGTMWGPVVGTIVFETLSLYIGPFSIYNTIILGFGVFVCATAFPMGIVPVVRERFRVWFARNDGVDFGARAFEPSDDEADIVAAALGRTDETMVASSTNGGSKESRSGVLEPVLRMVGVQKSFGGNNVLRGVDLELYPGMVHGLVGPNGSGKTTLLNVLTGFVQADDGEIWLQGKPLNHVRPYQVARRGIRRSFQVPQLVVELSVGENMKLGAFGNSGRRLFRWMPHRKAAINERVAAAASTLGMTSRELDIPVKELSLGSRRIVEIGRSMVAEPSVICLDEPAAGLAENDLAMLEQTLRRVAEAQCSVLLIEHNLAFVRKVADVMIELQDGRVMQIKNMRPPHSALGDATGTLDAVGREIDGVTL